MDTVYIVIAVAAAAVAIVTIVLLRDRIKRGTFEIGGGKAKGEFEADDPQKTIGQDAVAPAPGVRGVKAKRRSTVGVRATEKSTVEDIQAKHNSGIDIDVSPSQPADEDKPDDEHAQPKAS